MSDNRIAELNADARAIIDVYQQVSMEYTQQKISLERQQELCRVSGKQVQELRKEVQRATKALQDELERQQNQAKISNPMGRIT